MQADDAGAAAGFANVGQGGGHARILESGGGKSTRDGGALGDGRGDDHELARHAIAAPLAPGPDRGEVAAAHALADVVVEARPGERDRAADERGGARLVGVAVVEASR